MTARVVWLIVSLGCVGGCGGGGASDQERRSCEKAVKLCGYDDGMTTCLTDLRETKDVMRGSYDKFLACSSEANSCGEYVGCAVGGVGAEGMKEMDGLRKGMERMMGGGMAEKVAEQMAETMGGTAKRMHDSMRETMHGPTPAECERASEVCSGFGADTAADRCTEMMGNLKADAANKAKLTTCLASAKNCYAFRDCVDQLWFDLN